MNEPRWTVGDLARLARVTNAAVVSTFLNRSHTIAILAKALFAPRLRVVINVHEMLSDHLERFFAPIERRFMRTFIRYGFPRAERIIAVSEGVKQDLVRHFSIPSDRIMVVPNPVNLERIRRLGAEHVTIEAAGLSSSSGSMELYVPAAAGGSVRMLARGPWGGGTNPSRPGVLPSTPVRAAGSSSRSSAPRLRGARSTGPSSGCQSGSAAWSYAATLIRWHMMWSGCG